MGNYVSWESGLHARAIGRCAEKLDTAASHALPNLLSAWFPISGSFTLRAIYIRPVAQRQRGLIMGHGTCPVFRGAGLGALEGAKNAV